MKTKDQTLLEEAYRNVLDQGPLLQKLGLAIWEKSKNAYEKLATGRSSVQSPDRTPFPSEMMKVGQKAVDYAWNNHEVDSPAKVLARPEILEDIVRNFAKSDLQSLEKSDFERSGTFRG